VHFQALWPWASNLHKGRSVGEVVLRGENPGDVTRLYSQAIDWPEGVERWPPPEPAEQWRDAVPEDAFRYPPLPCRSKNEPSDWQKGYLIGFSRCDSSLNTWFVKSMDGKRYERCECQVRVEPEKQPRIVERGVPHIEPISVPKEWVKQYEESRQTEVAKQSPTGKDCLTTEDGWLPMDSAPKDGELISLRMGGQRVEGYWSMCGMWVSRGIGKTISWDKANQPTAWRPLS
jgi:hypothetical protein